MDENKQKAILSMVNDMKLTMGDFDYKPHKYKHTISIVCSDMQSLINAAEVFNLLHLKARHILFIPRTFKTYNFDSIDVSSIFGHLKSEDTNLHSIIIHDSDRYESGDFYIDVIQENLETGVNDYVSYQSLNRYCNELQDN